MPQIELFQIMVYTSCIEIEFNNMDLRKKNKI